jgi:hypothetical protein
MGDVHMWWIIISLLAVGLILLLFWKRKTGGDPATGKKTESYVCEICNEKDCDCRRD